jgi:hypothetical protein
VQATEEFMTSTQQRGAMTRMPRRSGFQGTRLVVFGLAVGVGGLWGVAWVLTDGGVLGISPGIISGDAALLAWAAVGLPGFAAALYFRGRAAAVRQPGTSSSDSPTTADHRYAQTCGIIAHALLQGPALLGGVFFLLLGASPVVRVALPVYLLGVMLTWPQREWFGEGAQDAASEGLRPHPAERAPDADRPPSGSAPADVPAPR